MKIFKILFLLIVLLVTSSASSFAVTIDYNLNGRLTGYVTPVGSMPDWNTHDYIVASNSTGSISYDPDTDFLTMSLSFAGDLNDSFAGPDIGNANGQLVYSYDNVLSVNLGGKDYLLAITDLDNNGSPAADGKGDGVGLFTLGLQLNGQSQSFVTDLDAKAAQLVAGNEYEPVASFVLGAGEQLYFALGSLIQEGNDISVHGWFMSAPFQLSLGNGKTGQHYLALDFHGNVTQIPEPSTILLLGSALLGIPRAIRRKN